SNRQTGGPVQQASVHVGEGYPAGRSPELAGFVGNRESGRYARSQRTALQGPWRDERRTALGNYDERRNTHHASGGLEGLCEIGAHLLYSHGRGRGKPS